MAHWTKIVTFVSIAGLVLTAIGVLLVWKTLKETRGAAAAARDAVDVTREIGMAQTRAYLFCRRPFIHFEGGRPVVRFLVFNSGNSPARKVSIEVRGDRFGMAIQPQPVWSYPGDIGQAEPHEYIGDCGFGKVVEIDEIGPEDSIPIGIRLLITYRDVFAVDGNDVTDWVEDCYFLTVFRPGDDISIPKEMSPTPIR